MWDKVKWIFLESRAHKTCSIGLILPLFSPEVIGNTQELSVNYRESAHVKIFFAFAGMPVHHNFGSMDFVIILSN